MIAKKIFKYEDIKNKICRAVDTLTEPIAQTISPRGGNVIFEDTQGNQVSSNDGVTIAKSINVKDEVENAIISIIKTGSLKTNMEVGDGTSSTILMSSVLIKEGLRLIENGMNQMELRDHLTKFAEGMKKELEKRAVKVTNDKELKFVAKISSNNDEKIANDVVKIVKTVGLNGQVMIDRGFTEETEIIEDTGFVVKGGVFAQELADKQFQTNMLDVPVLITDKRLYYKAEAEKILTTILDSGYNEVAIIAQDFIGEALPFFVANHINNKVRVILIKESKLDILEDLAIYLGGEVISDKKGSLVDNITIDSFVMAKRVFSDPSKTIVSRDKKENNKEIEARVKTLSSEMKKIGNKNDPDYKKLENRISSLTNGMVTIKVGGATPIEVMEKVYRYEDAINAARAAMREGYLPGGGVAMFEAFGELEENPECERMFGKATEINIRQIAINCGKNPDMILEQVGKTETGFGYNAATDKIEDLVKAGVIEPVLVAKQVIANAVSIANVILTSRYIIVSDLEEKDKENRNG